MEVVAFTEDIADLRVRYQIIYMKESAFVWVQPARDGLGSLPSLSVSTASRVGHEALPPATTLLGGGADNLSQNIAQKLASRCGMPVWASVDLGDGADVVQDVVFRRLLQELERRMRR